MLLEGSWLTTTEASWRKLQRKGERSYTIQQCKVGLSSTLLSGSSWRWHSHTSYSYCQMRLAITALLSKFYTPMNTQRTRKKLLGSYVGYLRNNPTTR